VITRIALELGDLLVSGEEEEFHFLGVGTRTAI
jgi:hypothetical protein